MSAVARLLLDTHAWLWFLGGTDGRLSKNLIARIEAASGAGQLWMSVISIWEIGLLEAKGRVHLGMIVEEWVAEALAKPGVRLAKLEPAIALAASRLPGVFHADPADRFLVATARALNAVLVTADKRIIGYAKHGYLKVGTI